jgi:predicted nucleic acid-binding protein
MTNRVMMDSSMLIEYIKKTKTTLLKTLLGDSSLTCCICEVVVSEFLFYYLKINSTASPLSAQSSKRIQPIIENSTDYSLLHLFHFLLSDKELYSVVPLLMAKYNLLPNDAIILATCKMHNITKLASHDVDFIILCQEEGIELLIEKE